uniref:EOG090X03I5 n=1 Tax=Eubosmina coregoni TaxID=186181 RepID=A0A4Y7LNQ8_9CRUS|nr:EOG090X03I5 [Eubosmina coregoni]SVE69704.1 EOG090X03I5 [Eubosmina coregoni]
MDNDPLSPDLSFSIRGSLGKARSQMGQFCDFFSDFSRAAPAYHHERVERSIQMKLYALNKRQFCLVFVAFFACFGMSVFIGLAGPPITSTTLTKMSQVNANNLNGSDSMATGPYVLRTPLLTSYHQQFWVIAQIVTENKDDESFEKKFHVSILMDGITEDEHTSQIITSSHTHNRTRDLQCEMQNCSEILILHMGFFNYPHYTLSIRFYGLESIHKRYVINDVNFFFRSYNPSFTRLEIWFRFVFLLTTFIVMCWFLHTMKKYSVMHWGLEQKWLALILMPMLIMYNDPLFALNFLVDSWIPGALDALFQTTFLCALLLFWLCVYHGLRQNSRTLLVFYLPKLILVGSIWLSMVTVAVWQEYEEVSDPSFSYKFDTEHFYGFKIFLFVASGIYLVYLTILVTRAYTELRAMPFFDMRLKFLTILMLFVLIVSISVTFFRYGVGILQDNFIAQLSTNYRNSSEFMALYGLLNFYIYTMAYVYSPTKNAMLENHVMKDNPAFSMVNDSDEDVVYEDKPLTINLTSKDDDICIQRRTSSPLDA